MIRFFYAIPVLTGFLAMVSGCAVSVEAYAEAEKNLCDCLSGVLAPADEFCVEWNHEVAETWKKLDSKMKRLVDHNPEKALDLQTEIDSVKARRQVCMEAISKYYGN